MSVDPRLKYFAYHEAGHAVMCRIYGGKVRRVSIDPGTDDSYGRMAWAAGATTTFEQAILVCAAGETAANRAYMLDLNRDVEQTTRDVPPGSCWEGSEQDREDAWGFAAREAVSCGLDPESTKMDRVNDVWPNARPILLESGHWRAVVALAEALRVDRTIEGARATAIVDAALAGIPSNAEESGA